MDDLQGIHASIRPHGQRQGLSEFGTTWPSPRRPHLHGRVCSPSGLRANSLPNVVIGGYCTKGQYCCAPYWDHMRSACRRKETCKPHQTMSAVRDGPDSSRTKPSDRLTQTRHAAGFSPVLIVLTGPVGCADLGICRSIVASTIVVSNALGLGSRYAEGSVRT